MLLVSILLLFIIANLLWGIRRWRRSSVEVRSALERAGYDVVHMERRIFREGPFSWTTTRSQCVFRFIVHESTGRERTGWARWGRKWLPDPDQLELKWDE